MTNDPAAAAREKLAQLLFDCDTPTNYYDNCLEIADAILSAFPHLGAPTEVEAEILEIMAEYDRQRERGSVDTPGGFEHLGDVWKQMRKWCATIRTRKP